MLDSKATPGNCCRKFAAFHGRPHEFQSQREGLDLDDVGRGRGDRGRVTVTARSLFLTRDMSVQAPRELEHPTELSRAAVAWHVDTYVGGLGLTSSFLERLQQNRGRMLDLAAGLSVFATEAAVLGVEVDCADLHVDDASDMLAITKEVISASYVEQMEFLGCLSRHSANPSYRMDEDAARLFDRVHEAREAIARAYPEPSGRRFKDDARSLDAVEDRAYSAVVCPWLLVHLDDDDAMKVIRAAVRMTRPDGEVRIKAGMGGSMAKLFKKWFGFASDRGAVVGREVRVDSESQADLLVLRVLS